MPVYPGQVQLQMFPSQVHEVRGGGPNGSQMAQIQPARSLVRVDRRGGATVQLGPATVVLLNPQVAKLVVAVADLGVGRRPAVVAPPAKQAGRRRPGSRHEENVSVQGSRLEMG